MLALIDKSKVHPAFFAPFIVVGERATTVVIVRFSQGEAD
jgi:hypothetical protein